MRTHQMQKAMEDDGVLSAEQIIDDGVFRRTDDRNGKPGNKLVGYVCHGNAGYYCHWSKMPEGKNWSVKRETDFTPEERQAYAKQMQQAKQDRTKAERLRHSECRKRSIVIWKESPLSNADHPYLIKKNIQAHGAKVRNERLVVPVYDVDNALHGLQYIDENGGKKFEPGTAVKGNFSYILGDESKPIHICEGYATAATIHEITGATVIVAFFCGNLMPVAEAIRARVGGEKRQIVIDSDNDRFTPGNPGLLHATAAATAIGARLAVPTFPDSYGTDFNDMVAIAEIEAVRAILEATAITPTPPAEEVIQKYELRPYQQRAMRDIRQAIGSGYQSIMVQSPTGSGKGVMLSHIIDLCHKKGSSVLFLVHSKEILFQVSRYMDKWGINHGIIKSGEIHEDWHSVQLATFQTIHRRLKNPYIKQADVIIVDEAHHATATTFHEVIKHFRKKLVLGFSATPSRQNGMGLGNLFDKLITVATIRELTDLGYLAPVRVYAPVRPDLAEVKVTAGEYQRDQLESAMLKPGLVGDIVGHWHRYGNKRKTIVFATGVKHSVALCQQFHKEGITAAHVDGNTPNEVRESILERFKAGAIQIIVNCMVFTEGVDVPDIGCVILARPTKSLPMYLQMVGRGMRVIPGKTDCILLDHAGAVHEHGFPDEVADWELSTTSKTVNKTNERRKKEKSEAIGCPVCDLLYTGRLKCPGCGNLPTPRQIGKDIEYIDGVLGEIVRKSAAVKKDEPSREVKAAWYCQLKLHAIDRKYDIGWAKHKFNDKFGSWPRAYLDLPPAQHVSPEVLGFITHGNIKRAKSVQKAA